jgi:hypothetical protein
VWHAMREDQVGNLRADAARPALAGLWAGFSRSGAGFFWFGLFREILLGKFIDLGRNSEGKSSTPRDIRGIGATIFLAM